MGIQRVLEGTDWPHCSTVYCLGVPGGLQTVVQLLGRATRKKGADHPMPHREMATIKFFLPVGDGSVFDDLPIQHSRHSLLLCAFLADSESGSEWIVESAVREAREGRGSAVRPRNPKDRFRGQVIIAGVIEKLASEGMEPTVEEVRERIAMDHPRIDPSLIDGLLIEALVSVPEKRLKVLERLRSRVRGHAKICPDVHEALRPVLDGLVAEFRGETLAETPLFARLREQAHLLTGRRIAEFHQRLLQVRARNAIFDLDTIRRWITLHLERYGTFPSQNSERLEEMPVGWKVVDGRCRKLGTTLPQLCAEFGHVPPVIKGQISLEMLVEKIKEFYATHGRAPTGRSGDIEGWPGETWGAMKMALRSGFRGLPAGRWTLARLAAEHCGHVPRNQRLRLSRSLIAGHMERYRAKHGELPNAESGPVEGLPGEKWHAWDSAGQAGCRGLNKGDTLADIKREYF